MASHIFLKVIFVLSACVQYNYIYEKKSFSVEKFVIIADGAAHARGLANSSTIKLEQDTPLYGLTSGVGNNCVNKPFLTLFITSSTELFGKSKTTFSIHSRL